MSLYYYYYRSRFVGLNKHHAYFLLVDNGTVGKYGAEIALRRKLEKFISTQRLSADFSTPLVCLVIEGDEKVFLLSAASMHPYSCSCSLGYLMLLHLSMMDNFRLKMSLKRKVHLSQGR